MDTSKMKNMVVLKDLPSNLIDEAIIILKPNKKIKSLDCVKNNESIKNSEEHNKSKDKDYIINEAQMVIANYISGLEEKGGTKDKAIAKIENKYKILKTCTFILIGLLIINTLFNFFKI